MSYFKHMFKAVKGKINEFRWIVNEFGEVVVFDIKDNTMVSMGREYGIHKWLTESGIPVHERYILPYMVDGKCNTWDEVCALLNGPRTNRLRRAEHIASYWCPRSHLQWDDKQHEWVPGPAVGDEP